MSSRRRRRPRRWLGLMLMVALALGLGYFMFGGEPSEAPASETAQTSNIEINDANVDTAASSQRPDRDRSARSPGSVSDMPRVSELTSSATRSTATDVPSITLGETRTSDAPRTGSSATTSRTTDASRTSQATADSSSRSTPSRTARSTAASHAGAGSDTMRRGMNLIADGDLVEGRRVLSGVLFDDSRRLPTSDARAIRETLASVNQKLVFSPEVVSGDPLAERYEVQSGDLLARIAPRYKLTYPFLEQINGIEARRLQVGQSIKLIRGPFHARVSKSEFRMDVFLRQSDGSPIYVRSFAVGLGEDDSTPEGMWIIEPGRKVVNPDWRNPRTGEYYRSDDPENPIGNYWLAMRGTDANTEGERGYGIHGTIEPDSIGRAVSMGCIRLRDGDIEQVFHLLVEGESTVEVVR